MKKSNLSQKFITFEGIEGCGKSTQSKLVADFLIQKGLDVVYTREPGGTPIGEEMRRILLDPENSDMVDMCELLLYMASRAQLVNEIIKPSLEQDKIVICDRFLDASICYQGYGNGIDIQIINQIGNFATDGLIPGLTIFLDSDVNRCIKTVYNPDRMERKSLEYHQKVRKGYLELTKTFPARIKTVKVKDDIESTQEEIREIVTSYLNIQ